MKNKDYLDRIELVLPALKMILSQHTHKTLRVRYSKLARLFSDNESNQNIFLKNHSLETKCLCINDDSVEDILDTAKRETLSYAKFNGGTPDLLLINNIGVVSVGDSSKECDVILDSFMEVLINVCESNKIAVDTSDISILSVKDVDDLGIDESETVKLARAYNKTIIVTGAAQGFGEGIARNLLLEGANIVVADLNEDVGNKTVKHFNTLTKNNRAIFVKTNVADMDSIKNMVQETIKFFGGIDAFINNAGVLRAGGLEDMTPEDFDFVTKINYNAYFYCTKVVSSVLKLQAKYAPQDYYTDIIQINSKSGLRGSKANFAYAGGKFGGIGLTQSFALELAPYLIKVNSICPGNYYEGPLWSDPENGLFVQYLRAGKVPGAKTVDDVKAFYLAQVPMSKGCTPEDVTKGVLYLMEQCGETGQALPITGGQVMLS